MSGKHKISAIIVAGGEGKRIAAGSPKQYINIGDETILEKSIKAFYNNRLIDKICVVISPSHEALFAPIIQKYRGIIFCHGGILRQDSVRLGLETLEEFLPDYVLIHDAARPFVSDEIIRNVIDGLKEADAVLPAVAVKDTIKLDDNGAIKNLPREKLYAAQTPQGFKYNLIKKLHTENKAEVTDDIALAEKAGVKIKLVAGAYSNYKITTVDDLNMKKDTLTGNGFDVHEFEPGDGVILCGVKVPYTKKLKGHSDADCGWHALTDALLGTVGLGDIGEHFPDTDGKWKGADSSIFLKKAVEEIHSRAGRIINADITIICEEPKLKLHKTEMKKKTAALLGIAETRVNIKATTTEKLGFLGRKEGLACLATASVEI